MRKPKYRLSPNEVERLVKEDQDQRRKLRIIQVREQAKANAAAIRNDVRREKERLLHSFVAEIKDQLSDEKEEKIRKLEQKYENTLRSIGEGHREVHIHGDGENRAEKLQRQLEGEAAAQERFRQALERQRKEDSDKEYEQTKHILARQAALDKEKQRAAQVASLPPPPPDISVEMEKFSKRAIPMTDMKAFATTHFHIPDYHVVRAGSQEQLYDARSQAQDSDLKMQQDLTERKRSQHERIEQARIRGNRALQKEVLKHEYEDMLKDLSYLQKQDRRQRQKMLASIPKEVFLPPELCMRERRDRQDEMESKFHEILYQQSQLDTNPQKPDAASSHPCSPAGQSTITTTPDALFPMSRVNPALRDVTNHPQQIESCSDFNKPETVLKQLLNKIKEQKSGCDVSDKQAYVPAEKEQSTEESGSQSVILAGSKACWVRTEDGEENQTRSQKQDDTKRVDVIAENERKIENLRMRIEQLQCQKVELARNYQEQMSLKQQLKDDNNKSLEDGSTLEEVDLATTSNMDGGTKRNSDSLEEIDLQTLDNLEQEKDALQGGYTVDAGRVLAASNLRHWDGVSEHKDPIYSVPLRDLQPVISQDIRSLQHEVPLEPRDPQQQIILSQMSLPEKLLHLQTMRSQLFGSELQDGSLKVGPDNFMGSLRSMSFQPLTQSGSGVKVHRGFSKSDLGIANRFNIMETGETYESPETMRRVNFDSRQHEKLPGSLGLGGTVRFDGGDSYLSGYLAGHPGGLSRYGAVGSQLGHGLVSGESLVQKGQGDHGSLEQGFGLVGSENAGLFKKVGEFGERMEERHISMDPDMMRKVREYRERAEQRQASIDPEMMKKVREYQEMLVKTHEERRSLLANIRAGIENRRQGRHTVPGRAVLDVDSGQTRESLSSSLFGCQRMTAFSTLGCLTKDLDKEYESALAGTRSLNPRSFQQSQLMVNKTMSDKYQVFVPVPTLGVDEIEGERVNEMRNVESKVGEDKDKDSLDKVRRSLPFDDAEESFNVSRVSWKDVLNDTSTTKHSQALTDDSRLTSSEEDRGSPVLAGGHLSNFSLVESSVDGSGLLAEAQERKLGFEHRQLELRQQLMDIQQQKDAIMQTYHSGQRALQQRQATLMSKLASASALLSESNNRGASSDEIRGKLAGVRSQIGALEQGTSRLYYSEGESSGRGFRPVVVDKASLLGTHSTLEENTTSVEFGKLSLFAEHQSPEEKENISRDCERSSSNPASGGEGGVGNVSSDSYLDEISFHKIRPVEHRGLPPSTSAFHSLVHGASSLVPITRHLSGTDQQAHTWASLLCSSSSGASKQLQPSGILATQEDRLTNQLSGTQWSELSKQLPAEEHRLTSQLMRTQWSQQSKHIKDQDIASQNSDLHPRSSISQSTTLQLTPEVSTPRDHEPHELSTILEVDTPASAVTSAKRSSASGPHTISSISSYDSQPHPFKSDTVTSISCYDSHLQSFKSDSYPRIDIFPDPPFTFLTGGVSVPAGYDLVAGSRKSVDQGLELDPTEGSEPKPMKAKRSLDFSDDLFATPMPALVELTPLKASVVRSLEADRLRGLEPGHDQLRGLESRHDRLREHEFEADRLRGQDFGQDQLKGQEFGDDRLRGQEFGDDRLMDHRFEHDHLRGYELKAALHESSIGSEESASLRISGYSDFLGQEEAGRMGGGLDASAPQISRSGGDGNDNESRSSLQCGVGYTVTIPDALQQAQGLQQEVDQLQQRSREVFGGVSGQEDGAEISRAYDVSEQEDSTGISGAVFGGGSGQEDSVEISGTSLGLSSMTHELEEVTISDVMTEREDVE